MVEPLTLCAFLFSTMITGAYEIKPGVMHVELLNTQTETIEELYVYTEDYLQCWDNGLPVQLPGDTDGWRRGTASYSWLAIYLVYKWNKQWATAFYVVDTIVEELTSTSNE